MSEESDVPRGLTGLIRTWWRELGVLERGVIVGVPVVFVLPVVSFLALRRCSIDRDPTTNGLGELQGTTWVIPSEGYRVEERDRAWLVWAIEGPRPSLGVGDPLPDPLAHARSTSNLNPFGRPPSARWNTIAVRTAPPVLDVVPAGTPVRLVGVETCPTVKGRNDYFLAVLPDGYEVRIQFEHEGTWEHEAEHVFLEAGLRRADEPR